MEIIDAISLHLWQTSISLSRFDSRFYLFGIQKIDMSVKEGDIRLTHMISFTYKHMTFDGSLKAFCF